MENQARIAIRLLEDGGQPADDIVGDLQAFLSEAAVSLDLAIYDCALTGDVAERVAAALNDSVGHGVQVRFAHYSGPHPRIPIPPVSGSPQGFLDLLRVPVRPVTGFQSLMHHKYVIRDAGSASAAVWTGSTNWTVDAWTREENVILQLVSAEIAQLYRTDFEELWTTGTVENSGAFDSGSVALTYEGTPVDAEVWFAPGRGEEMVQNVAETIAQARERVYLATPVLTVTEVLQALDRVVTDGRLPVCGVYDRTQMEEVRRQWMGETRSAWKTELFDHIASGAHLASKSSVPFNMNGPHDYMHVKMLVVDDIVYTGSFNFSHSGEENAENMIRFHNAELADLCANYIGGLITRYSGA